jgi:hypothetical protein
MYTPSMGDVNVLGLNISSHWTAIFDTTQECLILPEFMDDNIQAWLGNGDDLRFFLSDADIGVIRPFVTIPLKEICIKHFPSWSDDDRFARTGSRPIILGTTVIKAIIGHDGPIAFETHHPYRIRFPVQSDDGDNWRLGTVVKPTCRGSQVYYEPRNICIDPDCSSYYLLWLDDELKVCVWYPIVSYLVYTAVITFILMEVFAERLKNRAIQLAQFACERNSSVSSD